MAAQALELIVITPEKDYPQEACWVNLLFAEGLGTLHVRKPGRSIGELGKYLELLEPHYHERVVVHYKEAILEEFSVKGIHYKSSEVPDRKPTFTVSCGVHSWPELQEVAERVDYTFISPFFDSISKTGYKANRTLFKFPGRVRREKAVALGGICTENIAEVVEMQLKGAAVLGAVWGTENPLKCYRALSARITGMKEF